MRVGNIMTEVKNRDFVKLDRHIEEIIKTSGFLAKLKGQDEGVLNMLEEAYNKEITNYDNAVAVCFYHWFLADGRTDLNDTNFVFQVTFNVINKIDSVLEEREDYWILRILKYKIRSYMNFNENELIEELEELIGLQNKNEKMPYYFITELLLSHICYIRDSVDKSRELLVHILKVYHEKVTVLNNYFKGYIIEYISIAKRSGDDDILEMLYEIKERLFS